MPACYEPTIRPFQQPKQSRTLLQSWRFSGPSMARRSPNLTKSEALIQYSHFPGHTSLWNKGEQEEVEKICHIAPAQLIKNEESCSKKSKKGRKEEKVVMCSTEEKRAAAPWSRRRSVEGKSQILGRVKAAESASSRFLPRYTHTHTGSQRNTHTSPPLLLHTCMKQITHPDMRNLFVLYVFTCSIHHRASSHDWLCLRGRVRRRERAQKLMSACNRGRERDEDCLGPFV